MTRKFENIQDLLDYVASYSRKTFDEFLDPLSQRFAFHRAPATGEHKGDPMVLILGNHSSGKSTFINHILGLEVQRTGLAPIDDGFTILTYGDSDEKDGPALVNNPDLPFSDLEKFGPRLITHLKLKRRKRDFLKGLCLIDTPGMIDAADAQLNRGYDFTATVRWFVERSDVVLMFFDPDKPGTTGETLRVFTSALLDIDHKLLIVMNKMDQFRTLRDFARAYGALCWNLSKVIPRKDLPMIYTTYVPVDGAPKPALPLSDFQEARHEVVSEIRRAPARRIDNMLTRLHDHARKLRMHAKVCSKAKEIVTSLKMQFLMFTALTVLAGAGVTALTIYLRQEWYISLAVAAGSALLAAAFHFFGQFQVKSRSREISSSLAAVFETVYHQDLTLSGSADDLKATWRAIQDRAKLAIDTVGIDSMRKLKSSELKRIADIIEKEGPGIRSEVHEAMKVLAAEGKYDGPMPVELAPAGTAEVELLGMESPEEFVVDEPAGPTGQPQAGETPADSAPGALEKTGDGSGGQA